MTPGKIRIGTRGSVLALYQADLTERLLKEVSPSLQVETVKITTTGDQLQTKIYSPMESKRVFTKEIENALLEKSVDLAVHSAKDVAVDMPGDLVIGAVPEREDPRDCLLSPGGAKLSDLRAGARVGTSSLRRKKQIERLRPDLKLIDIRGNVETRIRKMMAGEYDAIVLAFAALKRLNLLQNISEIFDPEKFYPAPGQGVILIQIRGADAVLKKILGKINHEETAVRLACERAFLKKLEGGCQLPCGIHTRLAGGKIIMKGVLFAVEGPDSVEAAAEADSRDPVRAGIQLAEIILSRGGQRIIDNIRASGG